MVNHVAIGCNGRTKIRHNRGNNSAPLLGTVSSSLAANVGWNSRSLVISSIVLVGVRSRERSQSDCGVHTAQHREADWRLKLSRHSRTANARPRIGPDRGGSLGSRHQAGTEGKGIIEGFGLVALGIDGCIESRTICRNLTLSLGESKRRHRGWLFEMNQRGAHCLPTSLLLSTSATSCGAFLATLPRNRSRSSRRSAYSSSERC
jgi:hypothetical protein